MAEITPHLKVITGYRKDQNFIVEPHEAHKAYYLFRNQDKRGVFDNGEAVTGRSIQRITKAINATMGWNPKHEVDEQSMAIARESGALKACNELQRKASLVAKLGDENILTQTLEQAEKQLPQIEGGGFTKKLTT